MIDGQLLRLIEIFLLCRLGAELPSEGKGLAIFNQSIRRVADSSSSCTSKCGCIEPDWDSTQYFVSGGLILSPPQNANYISVYLHATKNVVFNIL